MLPREGEIMENNLLTEKWLTVISRQGDKRKVSLPELFSELERNDVADFPALLPHQRGPFHVFLVQLACHALETSGAAEHLPDPTPEEPWKLLGQHSPDEWQQMIRGIVPGYFEQFPNDEPWCLVTNDLSKPAFLQCPVPDAKFTASKSIIKRPDDLDLMISSKNFDIKSDTFQNAQTEDWFFALISLQTNSGFLGRGNYSCARQNGGWAQRPIFTLQSSSSPGARWGRDARVILSCKGSDEDALFQVCENTDDKRLLWLDTWDGTTSYELSSLHPLFIEVSRRVRAINKNGKLFFKKAPSACPRIDIGKTCGNLGDPWEPIVSDAKGVRVFSSSLDYANIAKIITGEETIMPNLLIRFHKGIDNAKGLQLWCSALVKGQGKTEGYFERLIPVDAQKKHNRHDLWQAAQEMLNHADVAKRSVLAVAVARFLSCGHEGAGNNAIDWDSSVIKNCLPRVRDRFEKDIDNKFFEYFWTVCDGIQDGRVTDPNYLVPWQDYLRKLIRDCYQFAVSSLPCNTSLIVKASALGELTLNCLIAKYFPLQKGNG